LSETVPRWRGVDGDRITVGGGCHSLGLEVPPFTLVDKISTVPDEAWAGGAKADRDGDEPDRGHGDAERERRRPSCADACVEPPGVWRAHFEKSPGRNRSRTFGRALTDLFIPASPYAECPNGHVEYSYASSR